jgi:hypothetical protein
MTTTISKAEQLSRRNSIDHNRSSSAIEGIYPDAATTAIEESYVRGELTPDQFSDALADMLGVQRYDHEALRSVVAQCERGEISVDELMARYDALTDR